MFVYTALNLVLPKTCSYPPGAFWPSTSVTKQTVARQSCVRIKYKNLNPTMTEIWKKHREAQLVRGTPVAFLKLRINAVDSTQHLTPTTYPWFLL